MARIGANRSGTGYFDDLYIDAGSMNLNDPTTGGGLKTPKIVWVNQEQSPAGQEYQDLLASLGYDVIEMLVTDPTGEEQAVLNAADLVVISRKTNSGAYNNETWDTTITAPAMLMSPYPARSSRWQWLEGTSIVAHVPDAINVDDSSHPIFDGLDTAGSVTASWHMSVPGTAETTSFNGDPVANGGSLIASAAGPAGEELLVVAEWPANTVAAGRRLLFSSGALEASGDGVPDYGEYDLTSVGEAAFINAIKYLAGPPVARSKGNIIWITQVESEAGQEYPDLLTADGYTVTERHFTDPTPEEQTELNAADLVIISRKVNSGVYNNQTWDETISAPLILMSSFLSRDSRWQWFGGSTLEVGTPAEIIADDPAHPILSGLDTTGGVTGGWHTTLPDSAGTHFTPDPVVNGGNLIASAAGGWKVVAEWPAGTVAVGPRLLFISGLVEPAGEPPEFYGRYDLTPNAEIAFLNAVAYMMGDSGDPSESTMQVTVEANGDLTLEWDDATFELVLSDKVEGPYTSAGATSPLTLTPDSGNLFATLKAK